MDKGFFPINNFVLFILNILLSNIRSEFVPVIRSPIELLIILPSRIIILPSDFSFLKLVLI